MEDRIYSEGLKFVAFFLEGCEPCEEFMPIFEELNSGILKENDFEVIKIDMDKEEQLSLQFGIMGSPTILLFKDGRQKASFGGAPKELCEEIIQAIVDGTDLPVPPEPTEEEIAAMEAEMEAEMRNHGIPPTPPERLQDKVEYTKE